MGGGGSGPGVGVGRPVEKVQDALHVLVVRLWYTAIEGSGQVVLRGVAGGLATGCQWCVRAVEDCVCDCVR